jgi:hypothetical protein
MERHTMSGALSVIFSFLVIPAKAGIHRALVPGVAIWAPACAGARSAATIL